MMCPATPGRGPVGGQSGAGWRGSVSPEDPLRWSFKGQSRHRGLPGRRYRRSWMPPPSLVVGEGWPGTVCVNAGGEWIPIPGVCRGGGNGTPPGGWGWSRRRKTLAGGRAGGGKRPSPFGGVEGGVQGGRRRVIPSPLPRFVPVDAGREAPELSGSSRLFPYASHRGNSMRFPKATHPAIPGGRLAPSGLPAPCTGPAEFTRGIPMGNQSGGGLPVGELHHPPHGLGTPPTRQSEPDGAGTPSEPPPRGVPM